jgi:hypothetical protein
MKYNIIVRQMQYKAKRNCLSENPAVGHLAIKRGGKDPDYDLKCGKIKGND